MDLPGVGLAIVHGHPRSWLVLGVWSVLRRWLLLWVCLCEGGSGVGVGGCGRERLRVGRLIWHICAVLLRGVSVAGAGGVCWEGWLVCGAAVRVRARR